MMGATLADKKRVLREAAALGEEVGSEDKQARVRSINQWARTQDKPIREGIANACGSLMAYIHACGYSPTVQPLLIAVAHATRGEDGFYPVPDAIIGYYIEGGTDDGLEVVVKLDSKHPERQRLAKVAQRAWVEMLEEQRRTGYWSLLRNAGGIDRERMKRKGGLKCSEWNALFVYQLAQIEKRVRGYRSRDRGEYFERAALEIVAVMDRQPETAKQKTMRLEAEAKAREARAAGKRPKSDLNVEVSPRDALAVALGVEAETLPVPHAFDSGDTGEVEKSQETPATRRTRLVVKMLSRLDAALVDAFNAELAEGADESELAEAFATLPALVESYTQDRVSQLLGDPVHPSLEIVVDKKQDSAPTSCPSPSEPTSENASKNAAFRPVLVDNSVHLHAPPPVTYETYKKAIAFGIAERQRAGLSFDEAYRLTQEDLGEFEDWEMRMRSYVPHTCPSPDVAPLLIEERVSVMCAAGGVSEVEAARIARRDLCEACNPPETGGWV
jgi:hypothetical protein